MLSKCYVMQKEGSFTLKATEKISRIGLTNERKEEKPLSVLNSLL